MILEKKEKAKKKKVIRNYMIKAQMKGKLNKRLRKETLKKLNKEKRRLKQKQIRKNEKREKERLRRKNKKILTNTENDKKIVDAVINTINNDKYLKKYYDFSYKLQIHKLEDIIPEIVHHIKYGVPWRANTKYNFTTLYSTYIKLIKREILFKTYRELLLKYLETDMEKKLSIQSTDVTVISNRNGSDLVQYNGHKKKKCTKSSEIHDINGVVLGIKIDLGAKHDSKIFHQHLDEPLFIPKEMNDEFKVFMTADSGYDSDELKKKLIKNNYKPIINPNNRGRKIKISLSDDEKEIYKNRVKATEHTYANQKTHRRINCRYEKNINNLYNTFYLAFIDFILKKQ